MVKTIKTRLDKSLPKVKEWAEDTQPKQFKWLEGYLAGSESVGLACYDIFDIGMQKICEGLLLAPSGQHVKATQCMAFGFARKLVSKAIFIEGDKGTNDTSIGDLDSFTQLMLGTIATGQPHLAEQFYKVILAALKGGYGVDDGHNRDPATLLRYAAFGLSIIGDWLNLPLDLDKHALPRDPAWGQLVAYWREPDPMALLPILLSVCDTHVDRIALTSREVNSGYFEFGSEFEAVYPAEILGVLRLRELIGLSNPFMIEHPLMETPYAKLTCKPGFIKERDELLQNFLNVAYQRDPQSVPVGLKATGYQ